MKRLLLATLILLGPEVGLASAEYLLIKIDLNKLINPAPPPGTGPAPPAPAPPQGKGKKRLPPGVGAVKPPPGGAPAANDSDEEPLWATAYLELKRHPDKTIMAPGFRPLDGIDHPWGKAFVPRDLGEMGIIRFFSNHSVVKRFEARKKALAKETRTPDKLVQLAEWALEHGLTSAFLETIDEVRKDDPKNAVVKAVDAVGKAMKQRVAGNDSAAAALLKELKDESYRMVRSDEGHYLLCTDLRQGGSNDGDVKKYLERLEATYHTFFYWFALKGKVLPVPTGRLAAVLVSTPKDFEARHESFNAGPMVADGFLARRDNVAVFSSRRRDEAYDKLEKINLNEWQAVKVGRDDLLSGAVLKRRDLASNAMLVARLQTLALLQKAMEEESERASVTHEGTRQLLAASGLLPRSVVAADWAHFGMASFFETPYKAYYSGAALPSWLYLIEFKDLKKTELAQATDVLLRTVTDQYFNTANSRQRQFDASTETREELEPLLREDLRIARTSAWALTYYLARHRLDSLQQYYQELGSLPGELEFDEGVLLGCFARAFGLLDASDSGKLDMGKVTKLADDWYAKMEAVSLDLMEVQAEELNAKKKQAAAHHRPHPHQPPRPAINPNPRPAGTPPPPARPKRIP